MFASCQRRALPSYRGDGGRVVCGHGGSGHVDRRRGGQQGAVGLLLEIAVGAFDVSLGEGVIGDAIDANGVGRCHHAAIGNAGAAGEQQNAVGRGVESFVRPGLRAFFWWLAVGVDDGSLLNDGRDSTLREKCGVEGLAGADAIGLAGS